MTAHTLEPTLLEAGITYLEHEFYDHVTDQPVETDIIVTSWPLSAFGTAHALPESDLHQRFPSIFPRFSNNGFSSLLRFGGDLEPPCIVYSSCELRTGSLTAKSEVEELEAQDNLRPSKRSKHAEASPSSSSDALTIRVPTLAAEEAGLLGIMDRLKEVLLPTKSKIAFIVSLLGGVPHLSYPPLGDELKLYSHIIHLYSLYGLNGSDALCTLERTLNALNGPQSEFLEPLPPKRSRSYSYKTLTVSPPDLEPLYTMFVCAWNDCKQNASLLYLLRPLLTRPEDFLRLAQLLGPTIALNFPVFLEFCTHRTQKAVKRLLDCKKNQLFSTRSDVKEFLESAYRPNFESPDYWPSGRDSLPWSRSELATQAVPPHMLAFVSSLPPSSSTYTDTAHPKILARLDLVYLRWPYLKTILDSGLSECRTRIIELPLSTAAIEAILSAVYSGKAPEIPHSTMMELFQNGVEFGLYNPSKLDDDLEIESDGIQVYYDADLPYLSPLALSLFAANKGSQTLVTN